MLSWLCWWYIIPELLLISFSFCSNDIFIFFYRVQWYMSPRALALFPWRDSSCHCMTSAQTVLPSRYFAFSLAPCGFSRNRYIFCKYGRKRVVTELSRENTWSLTPIGGKWPILIIWFGSSVITRSSSEGICPSLNLVDDSTDWYSVFSAS